jgi:hypothetical protein
MTNYETDLLYEEMRSFLNRSSCGLNKTFCCLNKASCTKRYDLILEQNENSIDFISSGECKKIIGLKKFINPRVEYMIKFIPIASSDYRPCINFRQCLTSLTMR